MKRLPDLPLELKVFVTAALIFAGLAVLMGLSYITASHQGVDGSYSISVAAIGALYTGPGTSMATIISIAHIHLLGLFSVFSIIGFIFVHSTLSAGWKAFLSVLPFAAFLVDVSGWFLTKMVGGGFVYLVILGGATFSLALTAMILMSLYELWIGPLGKKTI
jgi:hypothetical protein